MGRYAFKNASQPIKQIADFFLFPLFRIFIDGSNLTFYNNFLYYLLHN